MKHVGMILFLLGLSVASVFAARVEKPKVSEGETASAMERITAWGKPAGAPFAGGFLLMIVGGVIARRGLRAETEADAAQNADTDANPFTMFRHMVDTVAALPHEPSKQPEETQARLDDLLEERVPAFMDKREQVIDHIGLETFAEFAGHFSSMERNAARAWSALTDGCTEEATEALARARDAMGRADEVIRR